MTGRQRARQAARDIGLGIGTVTVALVLTFWGSLALLQSGFVLLTLGVLVWVSTAPIDRLRGESGWPRPFVFGGIFAAVASSAAAFSVTGLVALLLSCLVLGVGLVVGVTRVLVRVGD